MNRNIQIMGLDDFNDWIGGVQLTDSVTRTPETLSAEIRAQLTKFVKKYDLVNW